MPLKVNEIELSALIVWPLGRNRIAIYPYTHILPILSLILVRRYFTWICKMNIDSAEQTNYNKNAVIHFAQRSIDVFWVKRLIFQNQQYSAQYLLIPTFCTIECVVEIILQWYYMSWFTRSFIVFLKEYWPTWTDFNRPSKSRPHQYILIKISFMIQFGIQLYFFHIYFSSRYNLVITSFVYFSYFI